MLDLDAKVDAYFLQQKSSAAINLTEEATGDKLVAITPLVVLSDDMRELMAIKIHAINGEETSRTNGGKS